MDEQTKTELINLCVAMRDPDKRAGLVEEAQRLRTRIEKAEQQLQRERGRLALIDVAAQATGVTL